MDENMPDQAETMNRRSRKEEEYYEIQEKAREHPQEPRRLRSCSRNNEPHENYEDGFIAPRNLARKKSI